MSQLPKPAFSTEEEQVRGAQAILSAGDTTTGAIEKAVPVGEVIHDSPLAHVRLLKPGEDIIYYIFRGPEISGVFWGQGDFGLCVLQAAEQSWVMYHPQVEFLTEICRPEVYADDPRKPSEYEPYCYGGYQCTIKGAGSRLLSDERINLFGQILESILGRTISESSNGS